MGVRENNLVYVKDTSSIWASSGDDERFLEQLEGFRIALR